MEFVGIQLPGRENLIRKPLATTIADAVDAVLPTVEAELAKAGPVALFGHSSGAVVAFELARALDAGNPGRVARLFVSGSAAPWVCRPGHATGLPDEEFLAAIQDFAGEAHRRWPSQASAASFFPRYGQLRELSAGRPAKGSTAAARR